MSFPADVADFFFDAFQAPEFLLSAASSFFGGHTRGEIVSDLLLKMEAELFVEFTFGAGFVKQTTEPAHNGAPIRQTSGSGRLHSRVVPSQELRFPVACVPFSSVRKTLPHGPCRSPAIPPEASRGLRDDATLDIEYLDEQCRDRWRVG